MHIQKILLILLNLIFGSLVLLSYYNGINKNPDLSLKLWGGVPKILQPFIVGCMFAGALGYFFFTAHLLLNIDPNTIRFFNKFSYWYLHIIYLLILIPSALWIDLTFAYINDSNLVNWGYVISCLYCVALFSIFLMLFVVDTSVDKNPWLYLPAVFGSFIFTFHTVFLDGILWTIFFNKN